MWSFEVPNAPCGVERLYESASECFNQCSVPNAPCGVESLGFDYFLG
jgi:hypothetical protein